MKEKILIVDDDKRRTEIYVEMLCMEGYDVTFASNIKEAESELKNEEYDFDLVIVDIMIPYGDYIEENSCESRTRGIKFLEEIRKVKNKDELPVIVLTIYPRKRMGSDAFKAGCNQYLEKPCLPSVLLKKVKENLKKV